MGKVLRNTDILAGGGAALLLGLCVFALQLSLPLSIGLAIVAYVGLRLALPKPAPTDPQATFAATLARCQEQVTSIQQFAGWAGFAGKPQVRERLAAIGRTAKRILDAIGQDPNKQAAAEPYLNEYLLPITAVLGEYVRLANRDLALARDELARIEGETLPLIERRLASLYEQIHSADLAQLELATRMLDYTLQPISMAVGTETPLPDEAEGPAPARGSRRGDDGGRGIAAKEQAG